MATLPANVGYSRVELEVDQPSGSPYLLEVDIATSSTNLSAFLSICGGLVVSRVDWAASNNGNKRWIPRSFLVGQVY